jgi:hypothetical protein
VTSAHYAALVRCLLLSLDIISATEALQEMRGLGMSFLETVRVVEAQAEGEGEPTSSSSTSSSSSSSSSSSNVGSGSSNGSSMSPSNSESSNNVGGAEAADAQENVRYVRRFNYGQYASTKQLLVHALLGTSHGIHGYQSVEARRRLDSLYFALVEMVRGARKASAEPAVSRVVLDAIVEASGRMGMVDRAFATFQEYETMFNVQADIHSYNSLLTACLAMHRVDLNAMLAVFQDIETNCVVLDYLNNESVIPGARDQANQQSYSILFQAMIACDDLRLAPQVPTKNPFIAAVLCLCLYYCTIVLC